MKKRIIGAITIVILSSTITGFAVNAFTTKQFQKNNVIYSKEYNKKNIIDMNDVRDIETLENSVLIETETDNYYWER